MSQNDQPELDEATKNNQHQFCECLPQSNLPQLSGCASQGRVEIDPTLVCKLMIDVTFRAQQQLISISLSQQCRVPSSCPAGFEGRYTVRSGDSMFSIAQRCGVSLQALINANPHIANPNLIFPCDVLCVPPRCADTPACRVPASCPAGFEGRYTVRSGDSMFSIAQRCGVSLQALINANPHIANPNLIFPCDVLCVPPRCADM